MITDNLSVDTNGKKIIEVLVDNMWVRAMATDLRIINKNIDLIRVQAIRVRDLEEEI